MSFIDTDKRFCSIVLDVLASKGVKDVVCSPGSRNAPLLIAIASREELNPHVVTDERSAAFMALGLSLVSQQPVALICTSGTALLNYSPAIAEAYYQGVPLIVISADRPLQWIDQDDSQTLRQFEALSNFVKKSYELPAFGDRDDELQWYANRIANDAMLCACSEKKGPVHINIRLGEPLGNKIKINRKPERIIDIISADAIGNKEIIQNLAKKISESKVLFIAGFMPPNSRMQKVVTEFIGNPNVAVMAETISNLHLFSNAVSIDSVLTAYDDSYLDEFAPDIVLTMGGALLSRKLKEYLRRNRNKCEHWTIGYYHTTTDCFMSLSLRIETDPIRFFRSLNVSLRKQNKTKDRAQYSDKWKQLRQEADLLKNKFIKDSRWSELKAFDMILNSIPKSWNLFLSNGTPIRYAQIIRYDLPHASYCNRGVSGIDGSTSTAIGGAMAYKGNTLLITGDLSMAYDIGSLNIKQIPDTFKIIVIDNQGGGIFRFINSTSQLEERDEFFCAHPSLPLEELARGYGWKYYYANDEISLAKKLQLLFKEDSKGILKVECNGIESAEILKNYMKIKLNK